MMQFICAQFVNNIPVFDAMTNFATGMQLSNYGINTIHMQVTAEWIHKLFGNKNNLFRWAL